MIDEIKSTPLELWREREIARAVADAAIKAEAMNEDSISASSESMSLTSSARRGKSTSPSQDRYWLCIVWSTNIKHRGLQRLTLLPVLRNLSFRPDASLPAPFDHQSLLNSTMLFRRGEIAATSCLHCARGNDRYIECVRIRPRDGAPFLDFFFGACANCLPNSATSCSRIAKISVK